MRDYFVSILSGPAKTVYVGVTNNLDRRVWQHKEKSAPGFTKRYNVTMLVYVETFADPGSTIAREKQLKKWSRAKKDVLIASVNPDWLDLSAEWYR